MKRRTTIGLLAVTAVGLLSGVSALAYAGHVGREGMMQRFVAAAIDDALDEAKVAPEQRAAIHAARDRVFAAFAEHRKTRGARREELLRLFEGDLDPARLQALRQAGEEEHARLLDAVGHALRDAHDVLSPSQRTVLADYVRTHHRRHTVN
jgi:hypothetical protein